VFRAIYIDNLRNYPSRAVPNVRPAYFHNRPTAIKPLAHDYYSVIYRRPVTALRGPRPNR